MPNRRTHIIRLTDFFCCYYFVGSLVCCFLSGTILFAIYVNIEFCKNGWDLDTYRQGVRTAMVAILHRTKNQVVARGLHSIIMPFWVLNVECVMCVSFIRNDWQKLLMPPTSIHFMYAAVNGILLFGCVAHNSAFRTETKILFLVFYFSFCF